MIGVRLYLAIIFVLAAVALFVVGVLTGAEPTAAVNPVPCPTTVPVATATPDGGPTYTATLTHTPCIIKLTATPTPPPVGGISVGPELAGLPLETSGSPGPGAGVLVSIAGGVAAAVVVLGSAAWHAQRRASRR